MTAAIRLPAPHAIALWPAFGQGCYTAAQVRLIAAGHHAQSTQRERHALRLVADLTAALAAACAELAEPSEE